MCILYGIVVHFTIISELAHGKLASQAKKAIYAVIHYQKPFAFCLPDECFKIVDSMVKPFLCYGSQVW